MKSEQTHAENCELKRHALCQSKHKKSSLQVTWINKLFVTRCKQRKRDAILRSFKNEAALLQNVFCTFFFPFVLIVTLRMMTNQTCLNAFLSKQQSCSQSTAIVFPHCGFHQLCLLLNPEKVTTKNAAKVHQRWKSS